ncbi:Gibberellin 2-beta-dioxygenase 8 [Linum grandiflorum]
MNSGDDGIQLSYPPAFRRQPTTTATTTEPTSPPLPPPKVADPPVIDMENLDMEILREACQEWGVFRVANHGVPTSLIRQLKSLAREFFHQPYESKLAAAEAAAAGGDGGKSSYFWGSSALTPSGRLVDMKDVDWIEGVHFNGFLPLGYSSSDRQPPPVSDPDLFHSLRTTVGEYVEHTWRIARKLVEALGELLGVDDYNTYIDESKSIVRVYRYPQPPANLTEAAPLGLHAHTDSTLVSIVLEDDKVSGLEFIKDDDWLTLHSVPDTLLVHFGDMMQAISNDKFKSVVHRVKVERCNEDRISICYFVPPQEDKIIETSKYKPFTYKEFHQQVIEDIKNSGIKVGLKRFKRTT